MQARHVQRTLELTLSLSILLSASGQAAELGRKQDGSLTATLTEVSLQVDGATPGGDVAYLGANHEEEWESWGRLRTYSGIVTDEDADGNVEFAPELGISGASVWLVLDVTSGRRLSVTPEAFAKHLPREAEVKALSSGRVIGADREDLELLLYRPGVGVWFGKGRDGGQGDDSNLADGQVRIDVSAFRTLRRGGPAAPPTLLPGDRLLAIDLNLLDAISVDFQ